MTFGERLTALRKEHGLTQAELGAGLGTDGTDAGKQVVYGWEKDQHYPKVDQLYLLCEKLNCSADYLVLGRETRWPFSAELYDSVVSLSESDLLRVESVIRTVLGLDSLAINQVARRDSQEQTDPSVRSTTSPPVNPSSTRFRDSLIRLGSNKNANATRQSGAVPKQGGRRRA